MSLPRYARSDRSAGHNQPNRFTRREFFAASALAGLGACSVARSGRISDALAWGGEGLRDGAFLRPRAVGTHGGTVYVIDTTGRIQLFDGEGEFYRMWRTPAAETGTPTAIAFGLDGRVLVPDTHYSRILEYTHEGELLHQWGSFGVGADEFVYPTGIVESLDGQYYISEYGDDAEQVRVFDASRSETHRWGGFGDAPGQLSRAMAIDMDSRGLLYVADSANHRVQCFDSAGELVRILGAPGTGPGKLNFPYDLSVGPRDTLFVCEYGAHRISQFDAGGRFVTTYGSAGDDLGEFNGPRGVAVDGDGRVFVADTDNHRMQRFQAGDIG